MNSKQAVDYLVYYNIDTNLRDNDGDTAFDIAIRKGNQYLIKRFNEDFSVLINRKMEEAKDNNHDIEADNDLDNNNNQNIELNHNITKKNDKNNITEFINKFWGTNSRNIIFYFIFFIII